jgi:hypothetical protein
VPTDPSEVLELAVLTEQVLIRVMSEISISCAMLAAVPKMLFAKIPKLYEREDVEEILKLSNTNLSILDLLVVDV